MVRLVIAVMAFVVGSVGAATLTGIELSATGVSRSKRVSLQDCPAGENIVRGVIRPVEDKEFATIQLSVRVLASFEGGDVPKPLLYDDADNEYKTAQSFREVGSKESYTCDFSFRVPTGTTLSRITIDDVTLDVSALD